MSKRDIELNKLPHVLKKSAVYSVNKGMPFNNETLYELGTRDLEIVKGLRLGKYTVRIFKDE